MAEKGVEEQVLAMERLRNIKVPPYLQHAKKLTPSAWFSSQKSSAFKAVQVIWLLRENFIPVYSVGSIAHLSLKSNSGLRNAAGVYSAA